MNAMKKKNELNEKILFAITAALPKHVEVLIFVLMMSLVSCLSCLIVRFILQLL